VDDYSCGSEPARADYYRIVLWRGWTSCACSRGLPLSRRSYISI
jgi:hypothetical protein